MFRWGIMGGGFISSQFARGLEAVSYTHLDVYKRQAEERGKKPGKRSG